MTPLSIYMLSGADSSRFVQTWPNQRNPDRFVVRLDYPQTGGCKTLPACFVIDQPLPCDQHKSSKCDGYQRAGKLRNLAHGVYLNWTDEPHNAKALGIDVPTTLLLRADEVIE